MIYVGTVLKVIDNSGAKFCKCISLYKKEKGCVGDIIMVTVKRAMPNKKAKRGHLYKAVIVRDNKKFFFLGGHFGMCDTNAVVLLKATGDCVGTRIKGPIFNKLKQKGFIKLLTLSSYVY